MFPLSVIIFDPDSRKKCKIIIEKFVMTIFKLQKVKNILIAIAKSAAFEPQVFLKCSIM